MCVLPPLKIPTRRGEGIPWTANSTPTIELIPPHTSPSWPQRQLKHHSIYEGELIQASVALITLINKNNNKSTIYCNKVIKLLYYYKQLDTLFSILRYYYCFKLLKQS